MTKRIMALLASASVLLVLSVLTFGVSANDAGDLSGSSSVTYDASTVDIGTSNTNVELEYHSAIFKGESLTPSVTVTVDEAELILGTD